MSPGPRSARPAAAAAMAAALLLAAIIPLTGATVVARSAVDVAGEDEPDIALLEEALRIIAERFVDADEISGEALTRGAIRGVVEALGDDGHTVYLTPEELAAEQDALDGRVSGIGVLIDRRAGLPVVISVVDGSPADLAGLQSGDLIVSVDGQAIERLPFDDLTELVRGVPGTTVRLGLERADEAAPFEVAIERAEVVVAPVSWARVPGSDIALVRIVQFSADAANEALQALDDALGSGARGLILDLRGNPGGLVDEAVSIAGAFVEDGVAYRQRDSSDHITAVRLRGRSVAADVPLVVLIDYGTASSAEILAAALRDNDRARLVGERTFGTGTILNTFDLSDGSALRLGVLEWLTPDGEHVFRVGLEPDEVVERVPGSAALEPSDLVTMTAADLERSGDRQLQRAVELIEP